MVKDISSFEEYNKVYRYQGAPFPEFPVKNRRDILKMLPKDGKERDVLKRIDIKAQDYESKREVLVCLRLPPHPFILAYLGVYVAYGLDPATNTKVKYYMIAMASGK